jgi:hypothetical protein
MAFPSQVTADDQPAMKPALGHEPADSCPAVDYSDSRAPSIFVLDKGRKPQFFAAAGVVSSSIRFFGYGAPAANAALAVE